MRYISPVSVLPAVNDSTCVQSTALLNGTESKTYFSYLKKKNISVYIDYVLKIFHAFFNSFFTLLNRRMQPYMSGFQFLFS